MIKILEILGIRHLRSWSDVKDAWETLSGEDESMAADELETIIVCLIQFFGWTLFLTFLIGMIWN